MTTYTVTTTRHEWQIYMNGCLMDWGKDFDRLYTLCGKLNRHGILIWGNS